MPQPVGSAGCTTPDGVQHLSGNVAEWTDNCGPAGAGSELCLARGGGFEDDGGARLLCANDGGNARARVRSTRASLIGFRCCRDL